MELPNGSSIKKHIKFAPPGEPAGEPEWDDDFSKRLALLGQHNQRSLDHPDPWYALLDRTQGDFSLVQVILAQGLSEKLGNKPPSFEELSEVIPAINIMTKVGKTITQIEKLVQPYRRQLQKERSQTISREGASSDTSDAACQESEETRV